MRSTVLIIILGFFQCKGYRSVINKDIVIAKGGCMVESREDDRAATSKNATPEDLGAPYSEEDGLSGSSVFLEIEGESQGEEQKEEDTGEDPDEEEGSRWSGPQISEDSFGQARLNAASRSEFKRRWPDTCDGKNVYGKNLDINTKGFACYTHEAQHKVRAITESWKDHNQCCCKCTPKRQKLKLCSQAEVEKKKMVCLTCKQCAGAKKEIEPASLKDAFTIAVRSLTKDFKKIGVSLKNFLTIEGEDLTKEQVADGISKATQIRLIEGNIDFDFCRDELTPASNEFLGKFGSLFAELIAYELVNDGSEVTLCAHGRTYIRSDDKTGYNAVCGHDVSNLPVKRATALANKFKGYKLSRALKARVHHGAPTPHYAGGPVKESREGHLIYLIHEAGKKVSCKPQDLYPFLTLMRS